MHRVSGLVLIALTLAYFGWKYADAPGLSQTPVQPAPPRLAEGPPLAYVPPATDELWFGPDGFDPDGYPLRHVDKVALVSLVRAREFARAERFMERVQREFEADHRKEDWTAEMAHAFDSADPGLAVVLDAWRAQSPNAWQVYLARGMQFRATAWARRGTKYMNETSAEQIAGMDESAKLAADSLERAAALRPQLVAAVNQLLWLAGATHQTKLTKKEYLDRALDSCPGCLLARETFLTLLHPIWGGSIALVDRYATDFSFTHINRRLARLAGYTENVRCDVAARAKKPAEGLPHCDAAVRMAPTHIDFLDTRAEVLEDLGRHDDAFRDLTLALQQHPQRAGILDRHSRQLARQKRYEEAAGELITLRLLDPVDPQHVEDSKHVIQGLVYEGHQARMAGDFPRAIQLFGTALQLDPQHQDAQSRLSEARSAQAGSGEVATLAARLAERPDDFELRRALDAAYIKTKQLQPIVKMWNDFIASHPKHAGAYFERSGTYYHLKDMEHALADARKACELGLQSACQIAQRFAN